jgi:SagB-type dehydrogenase family enzyme
MVNEITLNNKKLIRLPEPELKGNITVEEAILRRRCIRRFRDKELNITQLSKLLWAGYGITDKENYLKAAPSAGALYPCDLFSVAGKIKNIKSGVYHYYPKEHALLKILDGDRRAFLATAALGQNFISQAPLSIVITAEYPRINIKYGQRGIRYAHMEVGHIGENIFLQAISMGLGAVLVGAFYDVKVQEVLNFPKTYQPLYIIPIGYP